MNRTRRGKLAYAAVIAVLAAAIVFAAIEGAIPPYGAIALTVLLFLPMRIAAWLWRDLLDARRRFDQGDFNGAVRSADQFLDTLDQRPWLRQVGWLATTTYSGSADSMAHGVAGAAHLAAGRLDAARSELLLARAADAANPLPVWNLAMVARARGDEVEAHRLIELARQLGFDLEQPERVLGASQSAYARIDGGLQRHDGGG